MKDETILEASSSTPERVNKKGLDITDITDITYKEKINNSQHAQDKARTTIYLPNILRDSGANFADFTHKSFSQLVVDSLAEYMINHKADINVENFILNIVQVEKKEKGSNLEPEFAEFQVIVEKLEKSQGWYMKWSEALRTSKDKTDIKDYTRYMASVVNGAKTLYIKGLKLMRKLEQYDDKDKSLNKLKLRFSSASDIVDHSEQP